MRHRLAAITLSTALIGMFVAVPSAWANAGNQKIIFTVNAPVDVPGHVLEPGRYAMKFADNADYDVVQITAVNGAQFIGYFDVIPVLRSKDLGHVELSFTHPETGRVPELKEFFYPGNKTGYELQKRTDPSPGVSAGHIPVTRSGLG